MRLILFSLALLFIFFSCSDEKEHIVETKLLIKNGKKLIVKVEEGKHYCHAFKLGIMELKLFPQMAFWIEDLNGNYIETLYVSEKFAKQKWHMLDTDKDKTYRKSSLPYWMNKRARAGNPAPTAADPVADALSSATPEKSFVLKTKVKENLRKVVLCAEFNNSFDYNDYYTTNVPKSAVNYSDGQPSVIFKGVVNIDEKGVYDLTLVGHGGSNANEDVYHTDTNQLTSALEIIDSVRVFLKEK